MTQVDAVQGKFVTSRKRSINRTAIALLASTALVFPHSLVAGELPTGANIQAGGASIDVTGNLMTVTQGTDRSIINWNSFSVGAGNTVNFIQPGVTSAILNRVTGATRSTIAGTVTGNGQVVLVNPNGIAITPTGTVNIGGGFIASTLDIANEDFLNGSLNFAGDGASKSVSNEGIITVGRGGYAALLGGTVRNDGLIAAPMGKIGLGAGERVTLDLAGDGFMQVSLPTAEGQEGDGALIENGGTLSADGGTVVMSAATAREAARKAVNMSGVAEARTVSGKSGAIVIGGGDGGSVEVSGKLNASAASGKGGKIAVSGKSVSLKDAKVNTSGTTGGGTVKVTAAAGADGGTALVGAGTTLDATSTGGTGGTVIVTGRLVWAESGSLIDVSGATGGTVLVGGDYQGGKTAANNFVSETVANATRTYLAEGAVIKADGTAGAGGKAVLWSDDTTIFAGSISARAAGTAAGGLIETSGHNLLFGSNFGISTISESGAAGTWLIDPYNVTISSSSSSGMTVSVAGDPWTVTPLNSGANINNSTLAAYLSSTNVTIFTNGAGSEAGNITVSAPVSWSANTTLTLNADATTGGIFINNNIASSGSSGGLVLIAGSGGINQAGGTSVTANTLTATASNGGSVSLTNAENSIAVLGTSSADGSFAVSSNRAMTVTGPVTFGSSLSLATTSGNLAVNAALASSSANADVSLTAADALVLSKDITLTGANAQLALGYGSSYTLANGARITLSGASSSLEIDGTGYTLIRSLDDLQTLMNGNLAGSFALASSIDAGATASWNGGEGFVPVNGFSGTFAGLGHFIDGLTINRSNQSVQGLFGLMSGTARDVTLSNVSVSGNGTVGSIAARLSGGLLTNVHVTGSVTAQNDLAGGLVGWSDIGTISLSSAHVTVSGAGGVGGLVGRNRAATISDSYSTGSVTGTGSGIGGLIGTTVQGTTLTNVYASGLVTGSTDAGGLIGSQDATAITVTNGYWDTGTTGQSTSAGGTGISTANAYTQATYSGFDFTNTWVMFAGDTRPMLRNEYSSVIATPVALQLMALDLAASYTLGANINMAAAQATGGIWGASGFRPVGGNGSEFTGSFNGNGHTISGMMINRTGSNYVGLFGFTTGATISNVTLSGGSVVANSNVGALIGYMSGGSVSSSASSMTVTAVSTAESNAGGLIGTIDGGAVSLSSASGNVTGAGYQTGGFVGYLINGGTVTTSRATGSVTGTNTNSGFGYVGGFVGGNGYSGGSGGTISQSYATGTVTGSGGTIGGFVGHNEGVITDSYATGRVIGLASADNIGGFVGVNFVNGTITNAYSTGYVTGSAGVGGFAGWNNNSASAITNAYWNTQTSGQSTGIAGGLGSATARTTAQLQGSLPVGFSPAIWGTGTNLYSYLNWRYSTTPVAVSGIAYSDAGSTALAGSLITAVSGGASIGNTVTGANGYYYILADASALNSAGVLTYVETGDSTLNAAFSDTIGTNGVQNVSIYGGAIHLITGEAGLLATQLKLASTRGSYTDTELSSLSNVTLTPLTTSVSGVYLDASAASYALDANLTAGGVLSLNSGGAFTIDGTRSLSAGGDLTISDNLSWSSVPHALTLNAGGNISLAGISDGGTNGSLVLNSAGTITASGAISVGTFDLQAGSWSQIAASLPTFSATDFRLGSGGTFLRVTGGDGSSGTPYQIADIYGLQGMASTSLRSLDFVLTSDLDASGTSLWNSGTGFISIGTQADSFAGSFDGQGHTISGLTVNTSGNNAGLFGYIGGAGAVSNLALTNVSISGADYVGGIAGQNFGTITNVSVAGSVTATNAAAGGIAGYNAGSLTSSRATADVTAAESAGGLTGQMAGGTLTASYYAAGTVSAGRYAGGIAGSVSGGGISNAFATGSVSASIEGAGGLAGYMSGGSLTNTYATGTVTAQDRAGGLVGYGSDSTITNSYATGAVTGAGTSGGLVGARGGDLIINASFFDTQRTGQSLGVGAGGSPDVTGLTTAQINSLSTFTDAGWSIGDEGGTSSVWRIYDGFTGPLLRSFMTGLTVTGGSGSKTYDGSASASSTGTLTYSDPGHDTSLVSGTAVYTASSADAGSYSGSNLILSGLHSSQLGYDITFISGTLTVDKAALTATANNDSKTYDGLAYSGGNGVTYSGFVNGETASVLGGTLTYGGTSQGAVNAGSYGIGLSGLTSNNYDITFVSGTLTVDRANLIVTARDDVLTANGSPYAGGAGVSFSGFVNGETEAVLNGSLSYGGSAIGATAAGSYLISVSGLSAANYTLQFQNGTLTINPGPAPAGPDNNLPSRQSVNLVSWRGGGIPAPSLSKPVWRQVTGVTTPAQSGTQGGPDDQESQLLLRDVWLSGINCLAAGSWTPACAGGAN